MPTSYEFHQLALADITISLTRQRKQLRGIEGLADSIKRNGLFHPIIVRRSGELVAGERRWRAFQLLGLDKIPVHYLDELDEFEATAVELEENIRRVDLTWQESCLARNAYHQLRISNDPKWTLVQTANVICLGSKQTGKIIQVAKRLLAGDKRIAAVDSFTAAYSLVQREMSRVVATEISQIKSTATGIAREAPKASGGSPEAAVSVESFLDWAPMYEGRTFNLLHCDFPYGIGYDKTTYSGSEGWDRYEDKPETYRRLLACLIDNKSRLFSNSAHLVFWFSMSYYEETLAALRKANFRVQPFPLIWVKNRGVLPDPARGPRRVYETALLASLGDRKTIRSVHNAFYHAVSKVDNISAKPRKVLEHFFEMVVDQYTEILDPTCGSGTALAAAKILGARRLVGMDINEDCVKATKLNILKARRREQDGRQESEA